MRRWLVGVGALLLASPGLAEGPPAGWEEVPLEEPVAKPPAGVPASGEAGATSVDTEVDDDEIVVWGTAAVREARARVVQRFEELGWRAVRRNADGDTVFKGPEPWMGSARLSDDALVAFRRRLLWLDPMRESADAPSDGMGALDRSGGRQADGVTTEGGIRGPASDKKIDAARAKLLRGIDAQMDHYRVTLAETALRQRLGVIPDRLDRLWADGTPLEPGPYLADPSEKRAAVLDYWATRPDTREGRLMCAAVEDWLDAVVQPSGTPATAAELDAAAARRSDGRYPLPGRP